MKKKLFRSFIVSLFVFTLFISGSNAEIVADTNYIKNTETATSVTFTIESLYPNSGYTNDSIKALLSDYLYNDNIEALNEVCDFFNLKGYGNYYCSYNGTILSLYFYYDEYGAAIGLNSENEVQYLLFDTAGYIKLTLDNSNTLKVNRASISKPNGLLTQNLLSSNFRTFGLQQPIKQLNYVSTNTWCWDGVSYYQTSTEPDFEGISDDEKATIINSVVSSNEFINIVPKNYRNQYFIIYSQWTNTYKIYFYPEQYYLKGRKFAKGEIDGLSYDSYKIVAFEGSNFFWDLVQSVSPFQYYIFSGSFDSENEFSSYFYGYENSHELNQHYFSVQDEPIVYSSRDIGFVIFDLSTGEYVEDTENGIVSAPLVDSSGNEIIIEIPEEEGPESIGFWDSFLLKLKTLFTDLFGMLGATIEFLLNKLFDLPTYLLEQYGENVFTLLFAIIVKALEVLVSSISLLLRFAGFLLTLVAIPADSTLFNVLVDGKVWGTHFIEGLDFLKSLSWNNLSFWRLFEWFVASLEVIWTVRIVRRHYSQIM